MSHQNVTAKSPTAKSVYIVAIEHAEIVRPAHEAQDEPYDAAADFEASINACYAVIRDRVAAGGKTWKPK